MTDRLPHANVLQDGVAQVEADVLVVDAGRLGQREPVVFELVDHVWREIVDDEIGGRLPQFQSAHDVVRHNLHDDAAVAREAIEVFPKRPHFESVVDRVGDELVRARADGVISKLASRAGGHDLEHEIGQERAGRLRQHEVDGVPIDRHDRGEIAKRAAPWRGEGRIEHAREREHDVRGCQLMAVVEADALAQPDPIRLMIRRVPRNGEAGREACLIVPAYQVIEDQFLRPGGVLIGSVSRVQVVGGDRDSDGDDAGFGCRLRAACRQQQQRQKKKSHSSSFFRSANSDNACRGVMLSVSASRRRCASFSAAGSVDAI